MASKINQLMRNWPQGTVAPQSWLKAQGVGRKLAHRYVKTCWLEHVGHGAYMKAGDKVTWYGAIYALQQNTKTPVWPGGATALALHGYGQYLQFGRETLWLWCKPGFRLPSWFRSRDWGVDVELRRANLFSEGNFPMPLHKREHFSFAVSPPERAAFEVAYEVSDASSFEWAGELVQGLVNLRPKPMQQYFEACTSIKVKRVLLFLATRFRLPWLDRLDQARIDLGRGKRQLVKGGQLDTQFQITVPRGLAGG